MSNNFSKTKGENVSSIFFTSHNYQISLHRDEFAHPVHNLQTFPYMYFTKQARDRAAIHYF